MSNEGPKIVAMPERNQMAAAIETLKRDLPTILEYTQIIAKIRKSNFDALIDEGFTEDQALALCTHTIV